jgi:hypothetical protein
MKDIVSQVTLERVSTALSLAHRRFIMSGNNVALGSLRAKLADGKTREKFAKVIDELLRCILELNTRTNTLLAKVIQRRMHQQEWEQIPYSCEHFFKKKKCNRF